MSRLEERTVPQRSAGAAGAGGVTGVSADGGDAAVAKPNDLAAPPRQKKNRYRHKVVR